jgi:hypothetical protein
VPMTHPMMHAMRLNMDRLLVHEKGTLAPVSRAMSAA